MDLVRTIIPDGTPEPARPARGRIVPPAAVGAMLVLAIGTAVLFTNLGGYTLWNPDEGRHAEVAREVLGAADWRGRVVPAFNGQPYHDKPILYYLAVSAAYAVGGIDEAAARAVSALAALGTMLAIYAAGTAAWGVGAGVASAAVLVTAIEFAALGRYGSLDMLLTCWVTLGTLACWRWIERPAATAWLVAGAVAAALGTLTKGLVAPVLIGGTVLATLVLRRRLAVLRWRPLALGGAVFVLVAAPWHVAAWHADPAYIREFFLRHQLERFAAEIHRFHAKPFWFPAVMTLAGFLPWTAFLPAAVAGGLGATVRRSTLGTLAAAWTLLVVAFFSVARGKLGTYILPALPPLALLVGPYCARLARGEPPTARERRLVIAGVGFVGLVLLLTWPVLALVVADRDGGAWRGVVPFAAVGIPLALVVLGLARWRLAMAPPAVGLAMTGLLLTFYTFAAPRVSAVVGDAALAATIARYGGDAPVLAHGAQVPSLIFYLRRPVAVKESPQQIRAARERGGLVFLVTSPRHDDVVVEAGGFWLWQTTGKHVLYASTPPPDGLARAGASSDPPHGRLRAELAAPASRPARGWITD